MISSEDGGITLEYVAHSVVHQEMLLVGFEISDLVRLYIHL